MFFTDAEFKKFLYRQRRSGGGVRLFLNFLCTFETHRCFNFSCKVSWKILFADTAFNFSVVKSLFCILCCSVYAKSNAILDVQTAAPRSIRLVAI